MDLSPAPPAPCPPRPSVAAAVLGVLRVAAVGAVLVVGAVAVLAAACLPGRPGGAAPSEWAAVGVARALLGAMGVRLRVEGGAALQAHRGFVFFSHPSFLDPLALLAVRPLRFLAAAGVRRLPLVGPMATALGTLYLDRGRGESRERARAALREAVASSPVPVALAPEGRTSPGPGVLPLRRGAFEVAAEAGAPVLLVALSVEPRNRTLWREGEWLTAPLWRVCARRGPLVATVRALRPALDAGRPGAAAEAERRLNAALGVRPAPTARSGGAVAA
ncbi:lysophospholipid acyltransferase family protein [Rubrivirga sp. S365]|uniref:Lysophospholipid acyltransferase family protein n=1 Tax=Rubrivirga litoralis TaxID=3075598 RepID=A0ABU3BUW0_9BACT|nr:MULTISPECIES: lysophospholipid acyltransferase family protein [unclassified Rubrivirga]MDT0633020.1 lysophospholipid acyltransferase family protein [Rubrivirga sp. F394]MDT7856780.1 lysophospholipid acyltransferase family protein [Rubrivirga sp. S365]